MAHKWNCRCKKCRGGLSYTPQKYVGGYKPANFDLTTGNYDRYREATGGKGEAPYTEVGGGETCGACNGTGVCKKCNGTSWYTLKNGDEVRCNACRPRGPKASEADRGKCWPCHGRGTERPTRKRRY